MDFKRLWINNFLTIGSAVVNLDNRGLNLVQGVNEDDTSAASNGAGKSSMVDAICWALFGTTARSVKGDAVVNRIAKKECSVILHMVDGDSTYTVERYRKHSTGKNSLRLSVATPTTPAISITKGTDAETQLELELVLGCSFDVFMAAVYSGQEVMPDLPRMTDKQLKMLIEESAGLQRIEHAYRIARDRMSTTQRAIELAISSCKGASDTITILRINLGMVEENSATWAEGLSGRINAAKVDSSTLKDAVDRDAKIVNDLKPATVLAVGRIKEINAQLAGFKAEQQLANSAAQEGSRLERLIDRPGRDHLVRLNDQAQAACANAGAEMAKPCPECGKPHTAEELETFQAHLDTKLRSTTATLKAKNGEVYKATQAALKVKTDAAAMLAALPDVSALNTELSLQSQTVTTYKDATADLTYRRTAHATAVDKEAAVIAEMNPHLKTIESLELQVGAKEIDLSKLRSDQTTLEDNLIINQAVVKVFGPAGVRAQILDSVTPYLNDRTADYLSVLSDGNLHACWSTLTKSSAGELKEKFSIDVSNDKGSESFLGLSGGEKRKVRLATALALQDLVASRATKPIGIWIGDEVDDALDASGLERLMIILERRAKERGTVIVISHSDLRDWIDNVTIVRKTGGASIVEGALCD
jgi:DNA repair exonuclease SbcCD ATPase subunit